jgi:tetratricopeptide (TPR) repeat protein
MGAPFGGAGRAVAYNLRAAEIAMRSAALEEAAGNLAAALAHGIEDLHTRLRVQLEYGHVLIETGRIAEGRSILSEAERAASTLGDRSAAALALVYGALGRTADGTLDLRQEQSGYEEAIQTFTELGDERGLALARSRLGLMLNRQEQWEAGLSQLDRALLHAEASGDPAVRRSAIVTVLTALPNGPTPVAEAVARCEELLRSAGTDRVLRAIVERSLGLFLAMAAQFDEALVLIDESSRVLDELHQLTLSSLTRSGAAYARELAGDRAGAERELAARWEWYCDSGYRGIDRRAIDSACDLGLFYCDEGRWDDAQRFATLIRDVPLTGQFALVTATNRLALEARLTAQRGRAGEAIVLAERAVAEAMTRKRPNSAGRLWVVLAQVLQAADEVAQAEAARASAIDLFEQKGNIAAAAQVRHAVAAAAEAGRMAPRAESRRSPRRPAEATSSGAPLRTASSESRRGGT